jgi:threonyl-tRNA synthetase
MAAAVTALFPGTRYGIGPAIGDGFYYDFELPRPLSRDDLAPIEARMREIVKAHPPFVRQELSKPEALKLFQELGQTYKSELIAEIPDNEVISIYRTGEFVDLCRGPHVPDAGHLKAFKLLEVAGAYWRGSERNPMLTRVYGTAFESDAALQQHLERLAEAEKRDHRKLGRELDLYSHGEELGGGLILWHPKGATVRRIIEDYWRDEHDRRGYQLVFTPHIAREDVWKRSQHLDFYRENMYGPIDVEDTPYRIKPMNCPFHIMIYKAHSRSYRELPIRYTELGTVYRHERSGVLHGLIRVRGFTQDDAHLFCRADQMEAEILGVLDFTASLFSAFGFREYEIYLSTRPEKSSGTDAQWQIATETLEKALRRTERPYQVDPGEGIFYGPKIDIKIRDALGRPWQCTTVQFDFVQPENFDLEYTAEDGSRQRPFMIHRALFGAMERFFGLLIEHYGGAFPFWLAPVQVVLIPIAERHLPYCEAVATKLRAAGIRVEVDRRNERMQAKIRDAQLQKVPYMAIAGDREAGEEAVNLRERDSGGQAALPVAALIERLQEEARRRG